MSLLELEYAKRWRVRRPRPAELLAERCLLERTGKRRLLRRRKYSGTRRGCTAEDLRPRVHAAAHHW